MRHAILVVGMALVCALAFTACSNDVNLGPTKGSAAYGGFDGFSVSGLCLDGNVPVGGITCQVYDMKGIPFGPSTVSGDNGYYYIDLSGTTPPPIGTKGYVLGTLNYTSWGMSAVGKYAGQQDYVNVDVIKF
jgi:hypothetical protein